MPEFCGDEDPEAFAGEPVADPWDEPEDGGDDDYSGSGASVENPA